MSTDAGAEAVGAGAESVRAAPPLPLALTAGVRRTFDTPGFAGMTFYEVQAKSLINRVSGSSGVPFSWTINPYRGCSHACTYCLAGDTPILMADGRTKPIADLVVGDRIYGTREQRFVETAVLAHWKTVKAAYRVRLDDGTELTASGDHRLLTDGGWAQVRDLTGDDTLVGVGALAEGPKQTCAYRRGYLCGVIRADAQIGSYEYQYGGVVYRFQMTFEDEQALARTQEYLAGFDVDVLPYRIRPLGRSPAPAGPRREMLGIRASGAADVATIRGLTEWPDERDPEWNAGFLAGVFDADGTYRHGVLALTARDHEMVDRIVAACLMLGFTVTIDTDVPGGRPDPLTPADRYRVRVAGGLRQHLRFFHRTDPAIGRKRDVTGHATVPARRLRVSSVENLGIDMPMVDITTGTGDFIANGVVSHNCFARHTHTYLDLDAGADFDRQIVVKVNAPELLRRELAAPRWKRAHLAMGTNVDVYQRAEGRYRLMPGILEALRDFANPFSILTKGTLILRDLDLLRQAAEVTSVGLSFSVGAVDEALWRSAEPGTPSPRRRLDAVRRLTDAGFDVGVLMAPILPGLSDSEESIDATVRAIAASGATHVVPLPLHLRPGAREWYRSWLLREHPDLAPRYGKLFGSGSYQPDVEQQATTARVRRAARRYGLGTTGAREGRSIPAPPPAEPAFEQLRLI